MLVNCLMDMDISFWTECVASGSVISKYYSDVNISENSNNEKRSKDSLFLSYFFYLFPALISYYHVLQELLELGEAVGTQSRGLTQEQISMLPVSKFKCGFFLRKKSRDER